MGKLIALLSIITILTSCKHNNPNVIIETNLGDITIELFEKQAPVTTKNFIRYIDGVISMARYGPGTATFEFFICVGDQPSLDYGGNRNPDNHGFAAFGKVIDGMDVVRKIHQQPEKGQYLEPRISINNMRIVY